MTPLHGVSVLVTRPERQAAPLCRLLEGQGAATLRMPVIEIKPLGDARSFAQQVGGLSAYDLVIFTSANAVRFGEALLEQRRDLPLAAIGPATVRALHRAGYRVAVQPEERPDSEGLLLHPRLERLTGHRVLLVKGRDGRALLPQELGRRGATVNVVDVYERSPVAVQEAALAPTLDWLARGAPVVTATSLDIGVRLLGWPQAALRTRLGQAHWLVPGVRVAQGLRERGLQAPLIVAQSAEDPELVRAVIHWRSGVSAA
jgi:uroporphyrinogen-III synthase